MLLPAFQPHDSAPAITRSTGAPSASAAPLMAPATVRLLGLDFAATDAATAAAALAARPADAPFGYVVTPNADHLVRIARDPGLLPIYQSSLLCLLDSRVVGRAARLIGLPTPPVATGSDVTASLLRHHLLPGERVTIIGLRAQDLPTLIGACDLAPPAHYDPPMGFDRDPVEITRTVEFVLAHPARFIFLAVGSPRQERLAAAIAATGRATGVGLCIGAGLEFLTGAQPRAPRWIQRAGLEWMYRLAQSPTRLARRYLIDDPPIFALLLRERLARG
jgi:N-acetylglucosaminyldiphosphoundecaprenol N-acetyl-beta-D-mannosaminyltransferase